MNRPNKLAPVFSLKGVAWWSIFKGTLVSLVVSLLMLLLASLVLHFTAVPEKTSPYLVFLITVTAILSGSYMTGKQTYYRGWLHGGLVGLLYVLLLMLLGRFFLEEFALGLNLFSKLFLGFIFGAAGGMWGVNSSGR